MLAGLVLRKAWLLFICWPIDTGRLRRAVRRGRVSAESALEVLWGVQFGDGLRVAVEDAREVDASGVEAIWGLTKLVVTVAFVLGSYELIWVVAGDHGLFALRAGYVEKLAAGRLSIHVALGLGGFFVGKMAHRRFRALVAKRRKILDAWVPDPRSRRRARS